jgi:hypothetical protein
MNDDTYYDYEPIPPAEQHRKYCGAPRHGATHVQAKWLEKYKAPDLGINEHTESLSCDDCHDSMLQAFMDEMLPDPTEKEWEELRRDANADS